MTYPDKPDERLLAHFKGNAKLLKNTKEVRDYLQSLGFVPYGSGTKDWPLLRVRNLNFFEGFRVKGSNRKPITLDQLKAEVAEVLGEPVASEPEEKPLSRQKFVKTIDQLVEVDIRFRELVMLRTELEDKRKALIEVLDDSSNVRRRVDTHCPFDSYEWSDDGFKTYTGRKVNE